MGLTFQQSFYQVNEEVFLLTCSNGVPKAIIEKPEDDVNSLKLKKMFNDLGYKIVVLNFDELILNGYELFKDKDINRRKEFDIY